jgi:capsular polysaccharide biosynthesis protein
LNLTEYLRILFRRWWIIALVALLAAGSAFAFSRFQTPTYRSTQKVLVLPSRSDLGLAEANTRLLESYAELLKSTFVAQAVIDELQLDMTPLELLGAVTVASDRLRLTVQIDVDISGQDQAVAGELANRIATAWGQYLVDYRNNENQRARREDRIDARLQDQARYALQGPRTSVNVTAGAVLGLIVGFIIVLVLEYLEGGSVRYREDLERTQVPVLVSIPKGK